MHTLAASADIEVSVVVPSYNARARIERALESLGHQRTDRACEVIVVDSSDDGTDRIVKRRFPWVKLIHVEGRVPVGRARNIGVRASRGRIIAFFDSDCVAQDGWLSALIRAHDEVPAAAGVGGSVENANPESFLGWVPFLIEFARVLPAGPRREVSGLVGCNSSYKSWVFRKYGLNHEGDFAGDDKLFEWVLRASGEKLVFEPQAKIGHINRGTLRRILSHMRHLGRGVGIVRLGYGLPYSFVSRWWTIQALLPPIRTIRVAYRLFRFDTANAWRMIFLWPIILLGFVWFGAGEVEGGREVSKIALPGLIPPPLGIGDVHSQEAECL